MQLEKINSRRKLSKNFSIHGKNCEISGPYDIWTPVKTISLTFETESVGPCLVQKGKWGAEGEEGVGLSPWPFPSGFAAEYGCHIYDDSKMWKSTTNKLLSRYYRGDSEHPSILAFAFIRSRSTESILLN